MNIHFAHLSVTGKFHPLKRHCLKCERSLRRNRSCSFSVGSYPSYSILNTSCPLLQTWNHPSRIFRMRRSLIKSNQTMVVSLHPRLTQMNSQLNNHHKFFRGIVQIWHEVPVCSKCAEFRNNSCLQEANSDSYSKALIITPCWITQPCYSHQIWLG